MNQNQVRGLVNCLKNVKRLRVNVFKAKYDSNSNVELCKARPVAKDFTKKDGLTIKTSSPFSKKRLT